MVDFKKVLTQNKLKKGEFTKFVALDTETSGIDFGKVDPTGNYQMISIGMIISEPTTFSVIEKFYIEIKYNGTALWDSYAEKIHGMSKEHLLEHGVEEEDAVVAIVEFLLKYFRSDELIVLCGQNVGSFDLFFLDKLLRKYDVPLKFSHRVMDTFALSMGTIKEYTSDDIFAITCGEKRDKHNALEDAELSLITYREIDRLWKTKILK